MKSRFLFAFLFLLLGNGFIYGQQTSNDNHDMNKLRSLKIKVVTQQMDLKPDQKTSFLNLYNKYSDELKVVYRQKHKLNKNDNSKYVVDQRIQLDKQILAIKEKYKSEFLKIISPKQLQQMYNGEDEFKQMLLQRLNRNKDKK